MSDSVEGDNVGEAAKSGSSSESSDVSIEKLNAEEADVVETKPTEDEEKEIEDDAEKEPSETKESQSEDDPGASKKDENEPTVEEDESNNIEIVPREPLSNVVSSEVAAVAASDDEDDEEDEDDFEDETIMERLVGLTEMFPKGLMKGMSNLSKNSVVAVKWSYSKTRTITWIVFSTASILFLPAMLESERAAIEDQDKMRKQQMLLGPSSALASAQNAPLPPNPA